MNRGKTIRNAIIILLFICALLLPIITASWTGDVESEQEKRMLAPYPVLIREGKWNPAVVRETAVWLEDHIGLRSRMVELVSFCKLKLMHQSPSDQVHVGRDGWYFYTQQGNVELATGDYEITEEMLAQFLGQLLRARDILRERGTEFVVVLPPSKATVYPEYLRVDSEILSATPVDIIADYIEENSDLKVFRLKQLLMEAKESEQVYWKTDTHWNDAGAYLATDHILRQLSKDGFCRQISFVMNRQTKSGSGDLMGMMGMKTEEQSPQYSIAEPLSRRGDKSAPEDGVIYASAGSNPCVVYHNASVGEGRALMLGDSFYNGFPFAQRMIAEAFSEFVFVRNTTIHANMVEAADPDILLWEVTERRLIGLLTTPFVDLHHYQSLTDIKSTGGVDAEFLQDGDLQIVVTDPRDPKIVYSPLPSPGEFTEILIQVEHASQEGDFQIFLAGEDGVFRPEQSVYFHVEQGKDLYRVSVERFSGIQSVRLDFPNQAGGEYRIDSVILSEERK